MKTNLILLCLVGMNIAAHAGEKMSDAEIKQKLLGYWKSPRTATNIQVTASFTCRVAQRPTTRTCETACITKTQILSIS